MPTAPPFPDLLPVFNAQPGATLLLSPGWVIVGASDDYLAATLTERATLIGRHIFDAFPDNPATPEANAVANVRASLAQVMATKQPHEMAPQHYDVPDPAQPGRFVERHWKPRHTLVLDAAGQVQFIIQSVQDITAERLAARQLRESQASEQAARADAAQQRTEFQHFIAHVPMAVAVYHGPEHRVETANATTLAIWGRTLDQVLHRPVFEALPEAATPEVVAIFDRVFTTGTAHTAYEQATTLHRHGRAEQVYWNVVFEPQRGPDGRISGIFTVGTDVTEQVRARQQLEQLNQELETRVQRRTEQVRAQSQRLERLFTQAPAAICILAGPELTYELVNPIYQQFFPERQLLGKPLREALPELADHAAYHTMRRVFETGETLWQQALHVPLARTADGVLEDRYFNYLQQARYDEQGRIDGVLVFGFEVTDLVQARQRAEALQAQVLAAAERQLQQREAFYQLFEQTPAAICIQRGPEHRYEYANAAYQAFFPGRELLGRTVAEVLPETVDSGVVALLDGVYQTGETYYGYELPLLIAQPEGPPKQMYFTFTYQAYRENGEIVGISTFAYDVAPQVLARQEREAQREQLYALFMQAPAAICILGGDDLVYELVNPNYQDLFPGRALLGRSVLDALPEIAGHAVYQGFRAVYATGIAREEKTLLIPLARPSDGALEDRYFNYLQQARRDAHGRIDGVLVFAFEVTEQVRARQASEASARQLRDITDALPVLIGYLDRDEKYRFANEAYRAWFHQDPAALLGQPIRQVAGEIAYQNIRGYVAQALAGERVDFETPMPFRPDFAKVIRTTYVPDVQRGQVVGCYTLVFDITEQTEARRQVEALNQELAAINEELTATNEDLHESNTQLTRTNVDLDNFIYTASHDLKAPISNIEGLLYLLQEELPSAVIQDDAVGPVLTRMLDAVERFKRTIDHLTEVSKLQKEHAADAVAVNLAAVVEDVRQDLLPLLQATGAKLVVDVPALPAIQFSEKNLRSIVYNLLSNAVKYHSPARSPHVDVRAHVRPGHTVFEVHDNGLGIAPDQLPRLFGMFQRFHDHVEGSGIGLYMVKHMVENAGGRIEVHSQLGAGTTFFVFLPHTTPAGAVHFPAYRPS